MSANISKYKDDLNGLIAKATEMLADIQLMTWEDEGIKVEASELEKLEKYRGAFQKQYQEWFSESSVIIRQLLHDRLEEFVSLYKPDPKRKEINITTYTIQDWLGGVRSGINRITGEKEFNDFAAAAMRFNMQFEIFKSVERRFDSSLFEIKQIVTADLFDSELEASRELLKNGFTRGAGAIAGVVVEKHLSEVCANHTLKTRKKNPSISDYYDLLKENGILDVPTWRYVQRLGDLRNLCVHNKKRDPTEAEVEELIIGVEKIVKTIF